MLVFGSAVKLPSGHSSQRVSEVEEPGVRAYFPGLHWVCGAQEMLVFGAAVKLPALQLPQRVSEVPVPGAETCWPAGQLVCGVHFPALFL